VILFDLCSDSEQHPVYQALEVANGRRQYSFLRSVVDSSLATKRPFVSHHLLKALNYHAIACLHTNAGEYRPCDVSVGHHQPPPPWRVDALMDDLVNQVNRNWEGTDAVVLAAFVLWRLNFVHPFINGNGRTARAAAYFVLCVRAGGWLPGATILPELIRANRPAYVAALEHADKVQADGSNDLQPLSDLLSSLLEVQLNGAATPQGAASPIAVAPDPGPPTAADD
jgi:Fic family protein